jgi:hypothetical protein
MTGGNVTNDLIGILFGAAIGYVLAALHDYNPWPDEFDTNKISPEEEEALIRCLTAEREARKEAT